MDVNERFGQPERAARTDRGESSPRRVYYRWTLGDVPSERGDGTRVLQAVLRVYHETSGVNYFAGTRHPNQYVAAIAREYTEGQMRSFAMGDGIAFLREEQPRFNRRKFEDFCDRALAKLLELAGEDNEQILGYFDLAGKTRPHAYLGL